MKATAYFLKTLNSDVTDARGNYHYVNLELGKPIFGQKSCFRQKFG